MPDWRFYGRATPRSRSPPRRGPRTHEYSPGHRSGHRLFDRREHGYSPPAEHDGFRRVQHLGLSPPPPQRRRFNPVNSGDGMPIGRSDRDRGRYGHGGQCSPHRRRRVEEREHEWGVAEDSRDGWRVGYMNGGNEINDEFGRIIGVDGAIRARPVEGRLDGDYGRYDRERPYSPLRRQHVRVHAENDMRGMAEDLRDGWRGGYRGGKSGSYDEFRRTDGVDGAGRMRPIGPWSDRGHERYGHGEPYSPLPPQRVGVQAENDARGVSEDFWNGRLGHQQTRRESDDEMRKDLDVDGGSDGKDTYRGDKKNVTMAQENESISSQYGESASGKVQWELLQKRGRNVDPRRRVGPNDRGSWSPDNSYRLSDGKGHKGKEVLNHDRGIQTSISMATDECLRNIPGFLDNSLRETYNRRVIDYGHADPYGTSGCGKPLLEGMPSQGGLSTEGELPHAVSVGQSKMYSSPNTQVDVKRERVPVNSRIVDSSRQNVNHEAFVLLPHIKSSREPEFLVHEVSYHRHDQIGPTEDLHGFSKYYMEQGSKREDFGPMSDNFYDKVRERYGLPNPSSSSAAHSLFNRIDELDPQENLAESQRLDCGGNDIGPSYARVEDRLQGLRDDCPDYSKETYTRSDHLPSGTGEGYEGDYGSWLCRDGLENEVLTEHDQASREGEWPFHVKHTAEEMDAASQYDEMRLKRWHSGDVQQGRRDLREELCQFQAHNEKFPAAMYEDKPWTVENNHVGGQFHHGMVERTHGKGTDKRIPVHMRLDFRKHQDIRRRLGPPLKITKFSEVTDLTDDYDGTYAKMEPSEDSEEFEQLVNTHFLRFFKFLNETSAQRRKYSNHGGSSTFRCRVCGSTSKEFGDIKALVMHAFMCQAVGLRSEHLGFHKALCVMIGWDSSYLPDTPWVPRKLSDAAASELREGLIIWPPVVVIHNSSLAKPTSKEKILVSNEDLEEILKGWGFGSGMKKVTRGKPANNSILLVIHKATLSGLVEAKKLDKFFADKGRGKAELENIVSGGGGQPAGAITENAASVLYGYLGIAEDLENLDFETKKRSVIRSRDEIRNIAGALK